MAPASVLVDDRHHIVNLSPSAGRFILHSGGPFSGKLDLVVRPELRLDLGHSLRKAFDKRIPSLTLPIPVAFNGHKHYVSMNVVPTSEGEDTTPQAVVLFLDGGPITEEHLPEETARPDEFRRLHAELKGAQEALATSRNEHDLAIQELRAANEELQSMNEEYRSTSEELETSKEELQSMNEELQAVNSELKSKLESISTTHNDLRNLTSATEIGTLFLDGNLRIRMFTPPMAELFNITDGDIGRPLTDFTNRLIDADVAGDLRRVLSDLSPVERELQTTSGHWFMMRVRPYRTIEERIDGVAVTFVDITKRREADQRLADTQTRYRALFDSLNQGFCVIEVMFDENGDAFDYRFLEVNGAFQEQMGLPNPVGKTVSELEPEHESFWFETFGRIVRTQEPERFETPNTQFGGDFYEVYAFPFGQPEKHQVGVLYHDISERREAERERELLTHELSHRVKNTLAVVQGLANQTSREAGSVEEFRHGFIGRLEALGQAHGLLLASQWQSADLGKLVSGTLDNVASADGRVVVAGPKVRVPPKQALGLALILHELATNAAKYGALSEETGRLAVNWSVEKNGSASEIRLSWQEADGPPVLAPKKRGFGTKLIDRACRFELSGHAELKFDPAGFKGEFTFPIL